MSNWHTPCIGQAAVDPIIDRSALEKEIRIESLRAELETQGFTVVRTSWLRRLNEAILKRKLEEA